MIRLRISTIIIHVVAWALFISFPILFLIQEGSRGQLFSQLSWIHIQFPLVFMAVFYLNVYYFFPKFYVRKKYLSYGLFVLAAMMLVVALRPFDQLMQSNRGGQRAEPPMMERRFGPPPGERKAPPGNGRFDILSFFLFLMVTGLGVAIGSIKEWQATEKRAILAEADRANAELSFLKAQINPHFLYNTLNNIYTLCITGSAHAAESIMKLSNIMRYITDEAEAKYVPLQGELDCIADFIDLQKLRLGKKVSLSYVVTGDAEGHLISPLILMTFIENVFKYGISNHTDAPITISIDILKDKIVFYCRNKVFENADKSARSGVGIKNTEQRLEHLYPDRYALVINRDNDFFTVNLVMHS